MASVGGREGAFAYTQSSGTAPTVARTMRWGMQTQRNPTNITPLGSEMEQHHVARLRGGGFIDLPQDDGGIEPLPAGILGDMTLTSSTGKTYTGKAKIVGFAGQVDGPSDAAQLLRYNWIWSAEASDSEIEANSS